MKKPYRLLAVFLLLAATLACSFGLNPPGQTNSPARPQQLPTLLPITPATQVPGVPLPPTTSSNLAELYKRVSPGVVSIDVISNQGEALGSGFVFDTEGHVITNYHVVSGATDLEVDFPSGYKARGKVIGTDLDSDIAVIQLENAPADQLHPLSMGDSAQIQVGDAVVAIGNPFGLAGTMTTGIVSALGRTLESERQSSGGQFFEAGDLIQTDAAINPGNSGGPLLNSAGEVIGINRAIATDNTTPSGSASNSGVGFAISINIVKRVIPVLIKSGSYDYPYLGISSLPTLSLIAAETLNLNQSNGAYITDITPGGPADLAGLKAGSKPTSLQGLNKGGDLIIGVDGHPVNVFGDLLSYLINNKSPGDKITLTILRDNQQKEVTLTLGKRP
ncbi:MAG: trypsin-like peptidase domain-containing protein [Anaerolineaceae bacterium]|nr:trypsin-like peptidase domain-containing protein [Anaerolineaceae bacterium]